MTPEPHVPDGAGIRAELAALGAPPMPPEVTARIGTALARAHRELAAEQGRAGTDPGQADPTTTGDGPASTGAADRARPGLRLVARDTGTAPRRPRRGSARTRAHRAALTGLAAAAVVAVAAVVVTVGAPAPPRLAGEESDLREAGVGAVGQQGAGALTDPGLRRACLVAAGVPDPAASLLGGRPYAVRGEPGTLLVLGDGVRGRFRLVVVDPGCGPDGGRLLAATAVGR